MKTEPLTPDPIYKLDACWPAANGVAVGQTCLCANPLLREPLTETASSLSGRNTGRTDLPLPARGEALARGLAATLNGVVFAQALTSPRLRARATCELAGLAAAARVEPALAEWKGQQFALDPGSVGILGFETDPPRRRVISERNAVAGGALRAA